MQSINCSYEENYYGLLKYILKSVGISDEIFELENDLSEDDYDEILGIKSPINISNYNEDKLNKLFETIEMIQKETDPEVIKNTHLKKDECVVTRLRAKITKITQL